jgi:hypothetical protein
LLVDPELLVGAAGVGGRRSNGGEAGGECAAMTACSNMVIFFPCGVVGVVGGLIVDLRR